MKSIPKETRIFVCYGPPASGKTTFAKEIESRAKNPIWLENEHQLSIDGRPLFVERDDENPELWIDQFDLVVMDGIEVSEEVFASILEWPTSKTFVLTFLDLPDFIPADNMTRGYERVTALSFPLQ
jgi:broad-specificity NMP kinase